jgi:hypothetical protein
LKYWFTGSGRTLLHPMARIRDIFDRERPGEQILHPVGQFLAKGDVMLVPDD